MCDFCRVYPASCQWPLQIDEIDGWMDDYWKEMLKVKLPLQVSRTLYQWTPSSHCLQFYLSTAFVPSALLCPSWIKQLLEKLTNYIPITGRRLCQITTKPPKDLQLHHIIWYKCSNCDLKDAETLFWYD